MFSLSRVFRAQEPSQRLIELDAMRGLAALSVAFFHYTNNYTLKFHPHDPVLFDFPLGRYGVHLFFIISGFVIFMTLEKTARPAGFIVSRFSRLFPCYWVAIFLTFTIVRLFSLPDYEVSFHNALFNLTMLQDWFKVDKVDWAYWTLTIEMSFYGVMILALVTRAINRIEAWGLLWLSLMAANTVVNNIFHLYAPDVITVTQLLKYGHLFFAGILFYHLKTKGGTWQRYVSLVLCLVTQYVVSDNPQANPVVLCWFLLFYLFVTGRLSWIARTPLVYMGTISYSFYLIHQNIGFVIINHLYAWHAGAWLRITVPMAACLLMASLMTYFIEKPAMAWIKGFYKKTGTQWFFTAKDTVSRFLLETSFPVGAIKLKGRPKPPF